jgi:3-hydroxyisobutyrate dehydrogenase-like beta-hydroxyacid dehydrogenase
MADVEELTKRAVGLLHPGEMGAAVGRCLVGAGYPVLWVPAGRGPDTMTRARAAGLTEVASVDQLRARARIILSICPPHAALDVARSVSGFGGLYVDANAISPATARAVASVATAGGATYVDGGIIGGPPTQAGTTRLYLSGEAAPTVGALFDGTPLGARVVETGSAGPFAASAVKMAYAAWTKGSAALLLTARALAEAEGVSGALLEEWALSQPALAGRVSGAAASASTKGWRWVGEMEEIAATMAAAGLPDGFHRAAAEVFRRAPAASPGQSADATVAEVITALPSRRAPAERDEKA